MDNRRDELQDKCYPVEEDLKLQLQIWRFERIGWYALVVVVLMTLLGLFSHGILSSTTATSSTSDLAVEYERFHRNGAVNKMVIHSKGKPGQAHTLFIGGAMLDAFSIDSMQPQPVSSIGNRKGLKLTLTADAQGESALYLAWRSDGIGLFKSKIAIEGGGEVLITQFIYP